MKTLFAFNCLSFFIASSIELTSIKRLIKYMENVSREIRAKGEILLRDGKVKKELETGKRIYFKVSGESDIHSVIFDKEKGKYECDCRFFALRQKECSHIVATRFLLKSKV